MKKKILDKKNIHVTFSLSEKLRKDDRFTYGIIRVMHDGLNPNGTYFSKESAESLVRSMRGVPVTGMYDYYKEDFVDHGSLYGAKDGPIPFGFVPNDAKYWWTEVFDTDGIKDYLEIEVQMWTKKYPEIAQFISQSKNHSMELVPDDVYGYMGVKEGQECIIIEEAKGLALTILGDDVAPAFESSKLQMAYSKNETFGDKFNLMVEVYNKYKGGHKRRNGGRKVFEFKKEIESLLKTESFSTIQDNTFSVNIIPLQTGDEGTFGYSYEDDSLIYNHEDKVDTLNLVTAFEEVGKVDSLEEEKVAAEAKVAELESALDEKTEEYEKDLETKTEEYEKDLEAKDADLEEAKTNYSKLLTKNEELEESLGELTEYKSSKEREEKKLIVDKYAKILSEEEVEAYMEKLDETTSKELKYQLGVKAYDALEKEENVTFNLNNNNTNIKSPSWAKKISERRK
jgi:hypothetical protein